jgi:uncharacterized protein YecE (DUF72 family)
MPTKKKPGSEKGPAYLDWKARKAERRQKQRAQNVLRAEKMHKARLEYTAPLPFKSPKLENLYIGCSGWFYWDWRGRFYPESSQPNEWFALYKKKFDTVELNAPFYSWPTLGTVRTWVRQAGKGAFVYTVKVSELITHVKKFTGTKELVKDFYFIAEILGPRMGCFLFQTPPSYTYTPARLKNIVSQLDRRYRNVVEFRHASWWNEAVYKAFRKAGIIFCSTSGPKLPDELIKTADEIYVRFHGKERWYRYHYSNEELQEWAAHINKSGAKRVWVYFNNDYETNAIKNAVSLRRML